MRANVPDSTSTFRQPAQREHVRGRISRRGSAKRSGAALVEFAILAPLLFTLILGIIEFGRAMMVTDLLNSAARAGCRTGVLAGSTSDSITSAVTSALTSTGIHGATVSVLVNGTAADASTAATGDSITVKVTVPSANVSWLPVQRFLSGATLGSSVVMRRE
jgi:Flp pilus assembly protein TadG